MKQVFFLSAISAVLAFSSCKEKTGYHDLNADKPVTLVKDENTGLMVDAETKKPVYIYVNEQTNDTIFGATGKVINGQVVKMEDGKYKYDDLKVKLDEDGDIKIKDGDKKTKIDGETGEVKNK